MDPRTWRGTRPHDTTTATDVPGRAGRTRRALVGVTALGLTAGGLVGVPAFALNSNPPTGPGNIEVFPKRDMVAVEGYGAKAGQKATVTVLRQGRQIGTATGTVDETGFLEINHPGGECWTGVTPNIGAGDQVRVDFADGTWDGATTGSASIASVEPVPSGVAGFPFGVQVKGTYGADVDAPGTDTVADPGRFAVEIVNPEMRGTGSGIGERAIGWPEEATPAGYRVAGSAGGGAFTVTYAFATASDQELALEGEPSVSTWQSTPEGVEAQLGLTISEFNEVDGPGFGGCPAGPEEMTPNSPTTATARGAGAGAIAVSWGAGTTAPEAKAITEYRVRAVLDGKEVGVRLPADARSYSFTGLEAGALYDIEITAVSASGESFPPAKLRAYAQGHDAPAVTATTTATVSGGVYTELLVGEKGVTFAAQSGLVDRVHYTTNGTAPTADSPAWTQGMSPIDLRRTTTLRFFAVDKGNVAGPAGTAQFTLDVSTAPAAPTGLAATAIDRGATLTWDLPAENAPTTYDVLVFRAGDEPELLQTKSDVRPTETADGRLTTTVTGLTPQGSYQFALVGENAGGVSPRSALSAPVTLSTEAARAEAGSDVTVERGQVVTLDGSASVGAAQYVWTQVNGDGGDPAVTLTTTPTDPKATFTFPLMAEPGTEDHALVFRLDIKDASGATLDTDEVVVSAREDVLTFTQARWRAGDPLRLAGTASVPGAVLTIRDEATSALITRVTVPQTGAFSIRVNATLSDGQVWVHSDHGYVGEVQTVR